MAKVIGRIDGDGRLRPRILFALGLLVDVVALGGMGLAIALTSGALLAISLAACNLVLLLGVAVAYQGRLRANR